MALGNGVLRWSMAKAAFNRRALSALVDRVICHKRITSQGAGQALGHYFANPSLPAQIQNYLLCKGSDHTALGNAFLPGRFQNHLEQVHDRIIMDPPRYFL